MKKTPDDLVATQIINEIEKEKVLSAVKLAALAKKLSAGGLDEQDWNLITEADGV